MSSRPRARTGSRSATSSPTARTSRPNGSRARHVTTVKNDQYYGAKDLKIDGVEVLRARRPGSRAEALPRRRVRHPDRLPDRPVRVDEEEPAGPGACRAVLSAIYYYVLNAQQAALQRQARPPGALHGGQPRSRSARRSSAPANCRPIPGFRRAPPTTASRPMSAGRTCPTRRRWKRPRSC